MIISKVYVWQQRGAFQNLLGLGTTFVCKASPVFINLFCVQLSSMLFEKKIKVEGRSKELKGLDKYEIN